MEIKSEEIKKICVLGWGLKGDLFIRIPVIEAIKRHFPDAELTVIVDPVNMDVLENHPDVDVVFPFNRNKKPLLKYLSSTLSNILNLRKKRFDLFVNMYSGGSSPHITRMVNARIRLGFDHSKALRKSNNLLAKHPNFCGHWITAFANILKPLGIDPDLVRKGTSFYCSPDADKYAEEFLGKERQSLVGINLGAGAIEKCWPVERFVALATLLKDKYDTVPVVFTNPDMEHLAASFMEKYSDTGHALNPPAISFDMLGALMKQCDFVITGDTSLMHLSFGLHRPTLALFTYTRPEWHVVEDCELEVCFMEDKGTCNDCGTRWGSVDMSVEYVAGQFDELYKRTMR